MEGNRRIIKIEITEGNAKKGKARLTRYFEKIEKVKKRGGTTYCLQRKCLPRVL